MAHRTLRGNEDNLAPHRGVNAPSDSASSAHENNRRNTDYKQPTCSPFRHGLIGSCITAFLSIAVLAIGQAAGTPFWAMTIPALLVGIITGSLISSLTMSNVQSKERRALLNYLDQLTKFQIRARTESFDTLRTNDDGVVGKLSHEVQRLVMEVYEGYSESIRLRRTMETTIESETKKATNRMNHAAYLDGLTHLSNRRALDETLPTIIEECRLGSHDVICLTIDIDYFKDVNDNIGHDRGDAILRFLGDSIRAVVRESDWGFRFGGDEFVIILNDLSLAEGDCVAKRLQKQFAQLPWTEQIHRICPKPTLSIGGVSFRQTGSKTVADFLKHSDEAMYGAKRSGKGCENIIGAPARKAA